jgi:hypothetical protein
MAEPLLTKDAINIGGHKFPIALVGGLAAVATVILVLRARSQGAQVASVGAAPAATDLSTLSAGVAGQTDAATLANLQAQLGNLQQSLAPPPGAIAATPTVTLEGRPGYTQDATGNPLLALWNAPGLAGGMFTELAAGTQLKSGGVPVVGDLWSGSKFWQPVLVGGQTKYVWAPDALANQPPI